MTNRVRSAIIGCGEMARYHLDNILQQGDSTAIVALCDPSPIALELTLQKFKEKGLRPPRTGKRLN